MVSLTFFLGGDIVVVLVEVAIVEVDSIKGRKRMRVTSKYKDNVFVCVGKLGK